MKSLERIAVVTAAALLVCSTPIYKPPSIEWIQQIEDTHNVSISMPRWNVDTRCVSSLAKALYDTEILSPTELHTITFTHERSEIPRLPYWDGMFKAIYSPKSKGITIWTGGCSYDLLTHELFHVRTQEAIEKDGKLLSRWLEIQGDALAISRYAASHPKEEIAELSTLSRTRPGAFVRLYVEGGHKEKIDFLITKGTLPMRR